MSDDANGLTRCTAEEIQQIQQIQQILTLPDKLDYDLSEEPEENVFQKAERLAREAHDEMA